MGSIYKNRQRYTGEASSGDNVFVKYNTTENEVVLNDALKDLIEGIESTKAVIYTDSIPETITDNFYVIEDKLYIGKSETSTLTRIYTSDEVDETFVKSELIGEPDGIAPLDENGRIPIEHLPSGALTYIGTWDASTGTLPEAGTRNGQFYIVNVAGKINDVDYLKGDWILWNGTSWERVDNSDTVTSVDGMKGEVDLTEKYAQLNEENVFTQTNTFDTIIADVVSSAANNGEKIDLSTGRVKINNKHPVLSVNGEEVDENGNVEIFPQFVQCTWSEYQTISKDPNTLYLIVNR